MEEERTRNHTVEMNDSENRQSRVSFRHTHINEKKIANRVSGSRKRRKTFIIKVKSVNEDENALACEIAFNL